MDTRFIMVKVAGVKFGGRQEIISQLTGKEAVKIVPEPDNPYDKNALAVHVAYALEVRHIGYVPSDMTKVFAPLLEGKDVIGRIFEITGGFEKWDGSRASYGVIVEFEIPDAEWEGGISN